MSDNILATLVVWSMMCATVAAIGSVLMILFQHIKKQKKVLQCRYCAWSIVERSLKTFHRDGAGIKMVATTYKCGHLGSPWASEADVRPTFSCKRFERKS